MSALREFSDLGAGFRIAALDLELRGAGNLLGREQHGHIGAVGFDLYCQMLERAVAARKGEAAAPRFARHAQSRPGHSHPARIHPRREPAPAHLQANRRRRQRGRARGRAPGTGRPLRPSAAAVENLLDYAVLKSLCERLQISSVERRGAEVALKFHPTTPVQPERLVALVRKQKGMRLDPSGVLTVTLGAGPEGAARRDPKRIASSGSAGAKMPRGG